MGESFKLPDYYRLSTIDNYAAPAGQQSKKQPRFV